MSCEIAGRSDDGSKGWFFSKRGERVGVKCNHEWEWKKERQFGIGLDVVGIVVVVTSKSEQKE